jgi:16S rRNA (guanine966-N2)-methyltransferase
MPRIIAGVAGGRTIVAPRGTTTRPTTDRVREALFSTLGDLTGLRVLDGYAGSGALGLEALSRGAAYALLVERAPTALRALRQNVATLGLPGAAVHAGALGPLLDRGPEVRGPDVRGPDVRGPDVRGPDLRGAPFDVVLLDPPYDQEVATDLAALVAGGWLAAAADIVVERATRSPEPAWPGGLVGRPRRYGETTLWYVRAP